MRDDGAGAAGTGQGGAVGGAADRTGYGLIGMHERVALLGGTLEAGGLDTGGFGVAAGLPLTPGEGEGLLR